MLALDTSRPWLSWTNAWLPGVEIHDNDNQSTFHPPRKRPASIINRTSLPTSLSSPVTKEGANDPFNCSLLSRVSLQEHGLWVQR